MLSIEEVRKRLADRRLDIVAEATGLSSGTIARIRDGRGDPTVKTLETLSRYLEAKP